MGEMVSYQLGPWLLRVPAGLEAERNPDGSWSAWDATHRIDVSIIEFTQGPNWKAGGPAQVLAQLSPLAANAGPVSLPGIAAEVGTAVETTDTSDGPEPMEWTRFRAVAPGTILHLSIVNRGPRDVAWHESVWRSVEHAAPQPAPAKGLSRLFRH